MRKLIFATAILACLPFAAYSAGTDGSAGNGAGAGSGAGVVGTNRQGLQGGMNIQTGRVNSSAKRMRHKKMRHHRKMQHAM